MKCLLILIFCAVSFANNEFTKANNLFTPALYKEISKNGNFLVSPFSAEIIFALTLHGCKGETAKELRLATHLPEDVNKIHSEVKNLFVNLKRNQSYTFHTANKLYIKKNFTIKDDFKRIAEVFRSDSENIDFTKRAEAVETMNDWVKNQTENKIQNLISSDVVNNFTRMILINALYFKADWAEPFLLSNTAKLDFHKTSNEIVKVVAMQNAYAQTFLFYECRHLNAKFLELPFAGEEASMTFVLPNEKEGLDTLENQIDIVFLPHNLTNEFVTVALPKFRIENKINLKKILNQLGVKRIFEDFKADLSGIAGEKGDLVIDEIVQKSFIDVNENGVEAAAATYMDVGIPAMAIPDPQLFIADHPFIFYIRVKGIIIFAGKVTNPIIK